MAKKRDQKEEVIVDVEEVYSKTETFIEENKNVLVGIVAALAIIIGGYFAYNSFYLAPLQDEAQQEMFMAEKYFSQDSMNLAIYGDDVYPGFIEISDNYSGTKAGNLANYYLGIAFLRTGQFEQAIDALNDFDGEDEVVGTIATGAKGDAYMELGDLNKAVDNYEKAASRKENDFTTPLYLKKAAQTYELLGEYENAVEHYKSIKEDYRKSSEASDIDKYIARAESYVQN
ncbi:MAG: tetratricopeptide repeat protein [Vicingaceae bacterium]